MPSTEEQMSSQTESQPPAPKKQGGSNKLFIILIAIVLLVVGALLAIRFGLMAAPGWLAARLPAQMAPMLAPELDSEEAKLAFMMETGQSGVCTMTDRETGEEVIYYVKGDMFKIETTEIDEFSGEILQTFVLNDGEYQYTWSSLDDQGAKYRLPSEEEMQEIEESISEMQEIDFEWSEDIEFEEEDDDRFETSCEFRNIPNSEFVPPQDIEFIDYTDGFGEPFRLDDSETEEDDFDANGFEMPDADDLEALEDWAEQMEERFQDVE